MREILVAAADICSILLLIGAVLLILGNAAWTLTHDDWMWDVFGVAFWLVVHAVGLSLIATCAGED